MDFASVIGSCSTGSATAVDSRTRDVTAHAAPRLTHGIQRAHIAVVRQRLVTRGRMGRLALDRDVGVFGYVERLKAVVVGESGGCRRGDSTIAGEQHKPVVHALN